MKSANMISKSITKNYILLLLLNTSYLFAEKRLTHPGIYPAQAFLSVIIFVFISN